MVEIEQDSSFDANSVDPNRFQDWEKKLFSMISSAMDESHSDALVSGKWLRYKLKNFGQDHELTIRLFYKKNEFIDSFTKISGSTAKKIEFKDAYIFSLSFATLKVKQPTKGIISRNYDDFTLRNLPKVPLYSDFVFYQISSGLIVDYFGGGSYMRYFFDEIANPIFWGTLETAENALSFGIRSLKHYMHCCEKKLNDVIKCSDKKELWIAWKKLAKISWIWEGLHSCEKYMEYLFCDLEIPKIIFENPLKFENIMQCNRTFNWLNRGKSTSHFMLYSSLMLSCYWNSANVENESYIKHYLSKVLKSNDEIDKRIINVIESFKTLITLFNDEFNRQDVAIEIFKLKDDWDVALKVTAFIIQKEKKISLEEVYRLIWNRLHDLKVIEIALSTLLTDSNLEKFSKWSGRSKEEVKIEELKWRLNHQNLGQEELVAYFEYGLIYKTVGSYRSMWDFTLEEMLNIIEKEIIEHSKRYIELKNYIGKMTTNDDELQNDLQYLKKFSSDHIRLISLRAFANVAYLKITPSAP